MALETLFLDAGGVFVNPQWERVAEILGAHGVDASADTLAAAEPRAKRALDDPDVIRTTDDGQRARLLFDLVLLEAGVRADAGQMETAWAEVRAHHGRENLWAAVPAGAPEALARLRAAVGRLVVVSNANGTLRALLDRLGLARHFHCVIDSADVGFEKPDARIFRLALERTGSRAEATLHVGDLYHVDVVGARAAGLGAVLLDAAGLYGTADCPRVPSLGALADLLESGREP